jgi:hypothetical protein
MTTFTLERDERRHLVLTDEKGQRFADIEPVRAFPLSDPRHAISICDSQGREILFIDSLDDVDEQTRSILEAELGQREFVPVIRRVLNTPAQTEPATWQVETDRGVTTFELESEDSVHRRDPHRVSIVDSRGIRYEIPDTRKLDFHSRRVLDRFL